MDTQKLDLPALKAAGRAAREEVKTWPSWERQAVRIISDAAASTEAREALASIRKEPK